MSKFWEMVEEANFTGRNFDPSAGKGDDGLSDLFAYIVSCGEKNSLCFSLNM